jgi:hypothetical protein
MRNLPKISVKSLWGSLIGTSFLLLIAGAIPAASDEGYLNKAPQIWTDEEALTVLNDSPWAKTVKPSTQDMACGYKNPAIPGGFTEDEAERLEILVPTAQSDPVKPDGGEYLIRWQSVKPMQAAVQRLLALGDQWKDYGRDPGTVGGNPTDLANGRYNTADMFGVSIILKHKGPNGESFLDYLFNLPKRGFPARGVHLWACAALKTEEGIVSPRVATTGHLGLEKPAITVWFPSSVHGKPLIIKPEEKVEFRLVAKQRVFEATFTINAAELTISRTERVLYYPTVWTDLKTVKEEASLH